MSHERVKREQLYASFCAWLDGAEPQFPDRDSVVRLRDRWPDLLQVTSTYAPDATEIDVIRTGRLTRSESLGHLVDTWAFESRTFEERRDAELAGYGPSFLPVAPLGELYALTRHALAERWIAPERWAAEVERFLRSPCPRETPFAQLASDAFASMGWLAERSQRPKIDAGMVDDVQAFATYAPFCDAFTVDRRFAHLLRKSPLARRLPSGLSIFAANELDRLEDWLIEVERAAPPGHFDFVRAIYGDGWLTPYVTILDPGESVGSGSGDAP